MEQPFKGDTFFSLKFKMAPQSLPTQKVQIATGFI